MRPPLPLLLIVEDDSNLRFLYAELLKNHFRITEAEDGESGLSKASELLPDCILTDHRMPRCTGVEMVERIRNIPALQRIPIVVTSGCLDPASHKRFIQQGVTCFLDKPVRCDELLAILAGPATMTQDAPNSLPQVLLAQPNTDSCLDSRSEATGI
jgi:CheY-like chemotaxis protein